MASFADYSLDPQILASLEKMGFKEPSPVQAETLPIILQGRDLIALAETGSGKTAACAIPICHRVDIKNPHIQALVIVPTRELALQYATEAQKIGRDKQVKIFAVFGGEDMGMQLAKLKHGVQVLIATPGRLIDFIYSRQIDLSTVSMLILDEADEMLSMGFYDDLAFIMQCLIQEHQTLLFSATMPQQIRQIAKLHMKDPLEVALNVTHAGPEKIDHYFLYCPHPRAKPEKLIHLIQELKPQQAIIFCQSRLQCEDVVRALRPKISNIDYLHAGLAQDVRTIITNKFRTKRLQFLVATNVAARGLDFSGITHVFIYQLASDEDAYVHRAGRTGRSGKEGVSISLVTDREFGTLKRILKKIDREPIWIGDPPHHFHQKAPDVKPSSRPSSPRRGPRKPPSPRQTENEK